MAETVIRIENVKKRYRLGTIGGGTLSADLQSWWADKRGKEDPNTKIGEKKAERNAIFWALDGINLEVQKGEAIGVIGANGAGKSTLLKLLSRVTAPTEGDIYIKGRIASMLEVGTGFHGELTGRENVYMNGAILGMSRKEVDEKIEDIIDFSECRQFIDTPVKRYSSGMYVKLAFSVAAHLDADIMIMDEVLAVGDMKFQQKCLGKMGDAAAGEGKTVLYVSHNMNTIRQLCTRCIVLEHGKIIFDGDVETAISIYMEASKVGIKQVYDLTEIPRHSGITCDIKMKQLTILNAENNLVNFRDKVQFELNWDSDLDVDAFIRARIETVDGTAVGISVSDYFHVCRNREQNAKFELDTSVLAPGQYAVELLFCRVDDHGRQIMLDAAYAFRFEVLEDRKALHNQSWYTPWGHTVLGKIEILQ